LHARHDDLFIWWLCVNYIRNNREAVMSYDIYELFIIFFVGFLVGAVLNRSKEDREQERIYEERYKDYEANVQYYKRLVKNLVQENIELRKDK
jgi:hypothetical protein